MSDFMLRKIFAVIFLGGGIYGLYKYILYSNKNDIWENRWRPGLILKTVVSALLGIILLVY